MDLGKIPLISAIKSRMHWLSQNQSVLAQNVANSDTPGYLPRALEKQDFSALLAKAPRKSAGMAPTIMQRTQAGHLDETGAMDPGEVRRTDAEIFASAPDGNAVDLEEQLLTMAQNQMDYSLMTSLYRKQAGLLRTALGRGGNRG